MTDATGGPLSIPAGARYMLGSSLFFSLMSLLVKMGGVRIPNQEIVFARGVVTLALSYGMVRRAGLPPWGTRRVGLVIRGIFGYTALTCYFVALTRLPIAEATVLQYTSPIWTALIAVRVLGEPVTSRVLGAGLMSFTGILLIARPAFLFGELASGLDFGAVAIALLGALLSSGAYIAVRQASKTEHTLVIVLYFALVTFIGPIPFLAYDATWPRGAEWSVLLGVGVSTQIAQVCLTKGLTLLPAARAMTIGYLQILFAGAWGAIFFGEYPDLWSVAGGVLVLVGAALVGLQGPQGPAGPNPTHPVLSR